MPQTQTTQKTAKEIAKHLLLIHEGLKLTEYRCTAGHRTIGVGFNLDAHPLPNFIKAKTINGKLTITMDEAISLLDTSLEDHYFGLLNGIAWYLHLDEWRQAALLDMAFNMGVPKLLGFKKTLALIQSQRFAEAAVEALDSKWSHDVDKKIGDGKGRADIISMIIAKGELPDSLKNEYLL